MTDPDIAAVRSLIEGMDTHYSHALAALARVEARLEAASRLIYVVERADNHGNLSMDIEDALDEYRRALAGKEPPAPDQDALDRWDEEELDDSYWTYGPLLPLSQPPAPEASVDALVQTISRVLSYAITQDGSSQQARDALKALAARLREAERERDEARELNQVNADMAVWKHDLWKAEEARVRELEAALQAARKELPWREHGSALQDIIDRALLGSGEEQEPGA